MFNWKLNLIFGSTALVTAASSQAAIVYTEDFDAANQVSGQNVVGWNPEVFTGAIASDTGIQAQLPTTSGTNYAFFNTGVSSSNLREAAMNTDTGFANVAGTIYTLTYDLIQDDYTGDFLAQLYVGDPQAGGVLLNSFVATLPTGDGVANAANNSHQFIGTSDVGNIYIRFYAQDADPSAGGFEQARLDTVTLDAVIPEPSSLALLGMGALAMLRRRRSM